MAGKYRCKAAVFLLTGCGSQAPGRAHSLRRTVYRSEQVAFLEASQPKVPLRYF